MISSEIVHAQLTLWNRVLVSAVVDYSNIVWPLKIPSMSRACMQILTCSKHLNFWDISYLISWLSPCKLAGISSLVLWRLAIRDYFGLTLKNPGPGLMILLILEVYGSYMPHMKSLFSLEFYGAFYKGLTTNVIDNLSWLHKLFQNIYIL